MCSSRIGLLVALTFSGCAKSRPPPPPLHTKAPPPDRGPDVAPPGAPKLFPPNVVFDSDGIHDADLGDDQLDSLCLVANQALRDVEIGIGTAVVTIAARDATAVIPRARESIEYCFKSIHFPMHPDEASDHLHVSLSGHDWQGRKVPPNFYDVRCDVPPTPVVEGSVQRANALFIDATDTPHALWFEVAAHTALVERAYTQKQWTELSRLSLADDLTPVGVFSTALAADGSLHVCIPLGKPDDLSQRQLLYAVRPLGQSSWLTKTVVPTGGPTSCAIGVDQSDGSSPRVVIAYDAVDPNPFVQARATLARLPRFDPGLPCAGSTTPQCTPSFENIVPPAEAQGLGGCGQFSLAVGSDGTVHVVFVTSGAVPILIYARRNAAAAWEHNFVSSYNNDIANLAGDLLPQTLLGNNPVLILDQVGNLHIFATVPVFKANPWSFLPPTLIHLERAGDAPIPPLSQSIYTPNPVYFLGEIITNDFAYRPNLNQPNLHQLASVPNTNYGIPIAAAVGPDGQYRVAIQKAEPVGSFGELRLYYDHQTDFSAIAEITELDGDYSVAIDSQGHTRVLYVADVPSGNTELDYFQDENGTEIHRANGLAGTRGCAATHFARLCSPLTNDSLRLLPAPVPSVTTDELASLAGTTSTVAGLLVDQVNLFLTYMSKPTIDIFNVPTPTPSSPQPFPFHDKVQSLSNGGDSALVDDVFRGLTILPGRTILKSQVRVCLPDFNPNSGSDARVCNDQGSAPLMPLTPESLPATINSNFATTSSFTLVKGPSPFLSACTTNGGEVHVDLTTDTVECILCADPSLHWSPADKECGGCPAGAITTPVPPRIQDPKTAHVICTNCPSVTPDSNGTQQYFVQLDDGTCSRCPIGSQAKACSSNATCEDSILGRTGYACGADRGGGQRFCEYMKSCSKDADCKPGNLCLSGRCIKPTPCSKDDDCGNVTCKSGHCDVDVLFDSPAVETDEHMLLCDPIGCDRCLTGNKYCSAPGGNLGACPKFHHCVDGPVLSPACVLRPVLQHPFVQLATSSNLLPLSLLNGIQLNGEAIPLHFRIRIDRSTTFVAKSVSLAVDRATVRIVSPPQSTDTRVLIDQAQGFVEVDVFFVNDKITVDGTGSRSGCGDGQLEIGSNGQIILRLFFQPFIDFDRTPKSEVAFLFVGSDMVKDLDTQEPAGFLISGTDQNGKTAVSCGDVNNQSHLDTIRNQVGNVVSDRLQGQLATTLTAIYNGLVFQPMIGELLFRYQPSCREKASIQSIETLRLAPNRLDTVYRRNPPPVTPSCSLPAADPRQVCR